MLHPVVAGQQQIGGRVGGKYFLRDTEMPQQEQSWTCSLHALSWVVRALGGSPNYDWRQAMNDVGYPDNVNPNYGLMDARGTELARALSIHGYGADLHPGLSYAELYDLVLRGVPLIMGGGTINSLGTPRGYYHWVGLRAALADGTLWLANSAQGWTGYGNKEPVYEVLREDLYAILGPWHAVSVAL